jgi:hypothetical protein
MTLLAPGAVLRPVANTAGDRMTAQLGLILHVQEGNGLAGLLATFNNPAAQASATWWVGKDGTLVQLADDPHIRMWAQGSGNWSYCSVETEGYTTEPLTAAQVATLGRLYAWGHAQLGWPLQLAEAPGGSGLGTHAMGGAAWGGHPCPGPIRITQRSAILAAAQTPTSNDGGLDVAIELTDIANLLRDTLRMEGISGVAGQCAAALRSEGVSGAAVLAAKAAAAADPKAIAAEIAPLLTAQGHALDETTIEQALRNVFATLGQPAGPPGS